VGLSVFNLREPVVEKTHVYYLKRLEIDLLEQLRSGSREIVPAFLHIGLTLF
jgi:hypothetical protein